MYRIIDKVNSNTLLTIYNTLILPHLFSYCCEIWANTYMYNSRINELILLQKRAVRLLDKVGYRDSTSPIFKKYNKLTFKDLIDFNSCVIFKVSNNILLANVH